MTGKQLLKIAIENGYELDRIHGSHHVVVKGHNTVTIPIHGSKDIPIGTARKILKQLESR